MTGDKAAARPRIALIVAVATNGVIGKDGRLPWHLSEDLKRFKALTMGHHLVMGRKTWESIGRALPGRTSVVITRRLGYQAAGAIVVRSMTEALQQCVGDPEVFVIGGGEIYREAMPLADRIYLTEVHAEVQGDTSFPSLEPGKWREVSREQVRGSGTETIDYDFVTLEKSGTAAP